MAEIHDGLAGRRQILLRNLVKVAAPHNQQTRRAHQFEMLGRVVITATGHGGDFTNRPRFARAQFLEDFPAPLVAEGNDHSVEVQRRCDGGGLNSF